jgi:hypothetical protein
MKQTEVLTALASDYRLMEYDTVYFGIEIGLPTIRGIAAYTFWNLNGDAAPFSKMFRPCHITTLQ